VAGRRSCVECGRKFTRYGKRCGGCLHKLAQRRHAHLLRCLGDITDLPGRPRALGHQFGAQLVCGGCDRSWADHQVEPQPCPVWGRDLLPASAALEVIE